MKVLFIGHLGPEIVEAGLLADLSVRREGFHTPRDCNSARIIMNRIQTLWGMQSARAFRQQSVGASLLDEGL